MRRCVACLAGLSCRVGSRAACSCDGLQPTSDGLLLQYPAEALLVSWCDEKIQQLGQATALRVLRRMEHGRAWVFQV